MALVVSRTALVRTGAMAAAARCSVSTSIPARLSLFTAASPSPLLSRTVPRAASLRSSIATPAFRRYSSTSSDAAAPEEPAPLRKTALYDLHVAHGGKMVPFGGFYMPVQYDGTSVGDSHKFTRSHASIFDVGHMVQRIIKGPGATKFLESITPSGLEALGEHKSTLSCFLTETGGGIVDDTVITKLGPNHFYVVTNAGCREKDDAYLDRWLNDHALIRRLPGPVYHEELVDWGLVALQGPLAKEILYDVLADKEIASNLGHTYFGGSFYAEFKTANGTSSPLLVSRGGYTGEDGFEIQIPPSETVAVTESLINLGTPERVKLAGLGARDSLRLEAGLCLYGHDLDESTTISEAGLNWIIAKERRNDHTFLSAETVLGQISNQQGGGGMKVLRRRCGLIVEGAPAREGAELIEAGSPPNPTIGRVTSGCPSPTLGQNIAMAYIKDGLNLPGTEVSVVIRGRPRRAIVTKMPFVKAKYHRAPKAKVL